jgi:ATP-dependent RNA helicase DDX19/DBP5
MANIPYFSMLPKTIQVLLFSATFPDVVFRYATKFAPNANQIKLKVQELTVRGISQMFMDCPSENDKYGILCQLYGLLTIGSSIIFVKVKSLLSRGMGEKVVTNSS